MESLISILFLLWLTVGVAGSGWVCEDKRLAKFAPLTFTVLYSSGGFLGAAISLFFWFIWAESDIFWKPLMPLIIPFTFVWGVGGSAILGFKKGLRVARNAHNATYP